MNAIDPSTATGRARGAVVASGRPKTSAASASMVAPVTSAEMIGKTIIDTIPFVVPKALTMNRSIVPATSS